MKHAMNHCMVQATAPVKIVCVLLGLPLMLGACGSLPKPGVAPALYDFGLPPVGSVAPLPVQLLRVEATPGLEGMGIRYRLAYKNPAQVWVYTESRWAAAPADLLAQRLRQQGLASANSACSLRVTLEVFDQVFNSPSTSHARVGLRADLVVGSGRNAPLHSTSVVVEAPANHADARGGVEALTIAADDATHQLLSWIEQQPCAK